MKKASYAIRLIITALFVCCSLMVYSRQYTVHGTISTNNPEDMIVGNVFILNDNGMVVQSALVEDGAFSMHSVPAGEYELLTSCIGFERKTEPISIHEDKQIHIVLDELIIDLNEVMVLGRKQVFINKDGNMKVNLDNPYFTSFSDLTDVLGNLPAVILSPDQESLQVIGKGNPLIYLGNQEISLDELKSLPVGEIESIEIIQNPSAKYDAEGRAVILLHRKKRNQDGYKVSITERASQKHYFNNNLGVNFNLMRNKFEFRTNIEYNKLKVWEKNSFDFNIIDENIQSDYTVKAVTKRPQFKLAIGGYYQINDNQYFSVDMNGRSLYETYPIKTSTYINNQGLEDKVLTENYSKDNGLFYTGNVNYELKLQNIDARLFIGGQYSLYDKRVKSDITDVYESSLINAYRYREQRYRVDAYSFKADYEQKFKYDINWEIGAKVSISDANTKMTTLSEIPDANENTNNQYDEYIYAVYTQLSGKTAYFSYSAGIRAEHTDIRKDFDVTKENQTKFFPKLSVGIPFDSTKSLSLNYAKSITRPNYSETSKMEVYINPFYAISGNIDLKPAVTDEVSINMQIHTISFGFTYYHTQNPIYSKTEYDTGRKLLNRIYNNLQKEEGFTIRLNLPINYKSFSSMNTVSGIYNKVKDNAATQLDTKPYLYVYSNNQFRFPKDYVFSLSGWGFTKRKEGIFEKNALIVVNASLSKTFFNKLECTLLFTDIFNTLRFEESFIVNNIESKGMYYADYRSASLTLRYSFGKEKTSKYKNQAIDENVNRMR